jgi:hypothetical protein
MSSVPSFSDADFKFKEVDIKPAVEEKKGNYNFLSNYTEPKREETPSPTLAGSNPPAMTVQNEPNLYSLQPQKTETPSMNNPSLSFPDNFFSSPVSAPSIEIKPQPKVELPSQPMPSFDFPSETKPQLPTFTLGQNDDMDMFDLGQNFNKQPSVKKEPPVLPK